MPRVLHTALILLWFVASSASIRAGVYVTSPREPFPVVTNQASVKSQLGDSTALLDGAQQAEKEPTSKRLELLKQVDALEKRELTVQDRVNLSAAYIRLGRHGKAIELLKTVLEDGPQQVKEDAREWFLLLANMAAAYNDGNFDLLPRAIYYQDRAIKAAPAKPPVPEWSQEQWDHFRIAERYYLRLLQLRRGEGAKAANWKTLDALFDKVAFVGPTGEYEPGKLSAENLHELPRDAMPIVVQLLNWLPNDARLYWLYAELLNGEGRINEAYEVLHDLSFARGVSSLVRQHRQILKEALVPEKNPDVEIAGAVAPAPGPKTADDKPGKGLPDWRTLGTGFLAGVLVALFGSVQFYLWRRRRTPLAPTAFAGPRHVS
jgi:hypothetical protein